MKAYYPHTNQGFELINGRKFPGCHFGESAHPSNVLMVGSWELIVEKILYQYEVYEYQLFLAQIDFGGLPFARVEKITDLLADMAAPTVKKATKKEE